MFTRNASLGGASGSIVHKPATIEFGKEFWLYPRQAQVEIPVRGSGGLWGVQRAQYEIYVRPRAQMSVSVSIKYKMPPLAPGDFLPKT